MWWEGWEGVSQRNNERKMTHAEGIKNARALRQEKNTWVIQTKRRLVSVGKRSRGNTHQLPDPISSIQQIKKPRPRVVKQFAHSHSFNYWFLTRTPETKSHTINFWSNFFFPTAYDRLILTFKHRHEGREKYFIF